MLKHIFIINPIAGKGKGINLISNIKNIFQDKTDKYIIEVTNQPGHAEFIAKSYSSAEKCRIYSIGGDGTLNEIINGMAGSDSELAIIPCGTGNDFIRSIITNSNLEELLINTINSSNHKKVDIAKINSRYFINIASVGFDAQVVHNTQKYKKIPGISGSFAYILGILNTVFKYKGSKVKINIDGNIIEKTLLLAAIANGRFYGGGMQPAPKADLFDGHLDVCLIENTNIFKILTFFPRLIKGTHDSLKEVSFYKGKSIEIIGDSDIYLNADGEVFKGKKATIEIQSNGLSVIFPFEESISDTSEHLITNVSNI